MSRWCAVVRRTLPDCGRAGNADYKNVIVKVKRLPAGQDVASFLAANPSHDWANPGFHSYIVQLTDTQGENYNAQGPGFFFHGGQSNLPRWQNENEGSGSAFAPGSFADPTDTVSAFTAAVPLDDDRFVVRFYDGNPDAGGTLLNRFKFVEGDAAQVWMAVANDADVRRTWNNAGRKVEINNTRFSLDFGSSHSPALQPGATSFLVDTSRSGRMRIVDSGAFRVEGPMPGGALFTVFATTLRI